MSKLKPPYQMRSLFSSTEIKNLHEQINNVYAEELDSDDSENMEIMRSNQRRIMEHDEWK